MNVAPPTRTVVQAEALGWLAEHAAPTGASVVTSLPDASEVPELAFDAWRAWFVGAARAVFEWVAPVGVAVFYQSDITHDGVWVDKGYLVSRAAEDAGATLLWHKIVCRKPPGTTAHGRSTYSHMLAFSKTPRAFRASADVLPDAGAMPWSKAMGAAACVEACTFLRDEVGAKLVVDPFCGSGTALAVANALGLDSLGVDRSARRCRLARKLRLTL